MLKKILDGWRPGWKQNRWNATLIALPIILICVPLLLLAIPYLEILNDMAVQPKGKAQGQYGWFSDQQITVERAPVPGTIPVTWFSHPHPKDSEKDTKFAELSGKELMSPYGDSFKPAADEAMKAVRTAAMERGKILFTRICSACHGPKAEGNGPITGPDLFPAPPSLHTAEALKFKDGHIFHIITRGQKKMPSYADFFEPSERWDLVIYVRAMQMAKQMADK